MQMAYCHEFEQKVFPKNTRYSKKRWVKSQRSIATKPSLELDLIKDADEGKHSVKRWLTSS